MYIVYTNWIDVDRIQTTEFILRRGGTRGLVGGGGASAGRAGSGEKRNFHSEHFCCPLFAFEPALRYHSTTFSAALTELVDEAVPACVTLIAVLMGVSTTSASHHLTRTRGRPGVRVRC